jgi:hypothetical protein
MKGDYLMKTLIIAALFSSMLFLQTSIAAEIPPQDAKPLSEIVLSLEKLGYSPIVEIEFEEGKWEVKAYKEGAKHKIEVNPISGKIASDRKDD